jgi:hypothetical protein
MSSQGLNATTYSGFKHTVPGSSPGFPLRDASDRTRMLKNSLLFKQYTGTAVPPITIIRTTFTEPQSNENRLNYQFGQVTCDSCSSFPTGQLGS